MARLYSDIGTKIEEFLEQSGMSQTDLAARIGVSKQVMNKIIRGKKAINLNEIERIAEIMQVSIDSIIKNKLHFEKNEPAFLMMGAIGNDNTIDDLRFLNHVMDEMINLEDLLQGSGVIS